ncbi:hypothetical protein AWR27_04245 [Spirosoma montaniterrae]|uniref:Uncharacterized protein n=1 Tax=Spirosoma montaniterrae TaxID=1178516 RepID=A0A1P9X3Y3_9BACT|nr:hypothetical protein AWR27_04245 [Spirosoma montaniterrae]
MAFAFLAAWVWLSELPVLSRISQNNQARIDAEKAYKSKAYQDALRLYAHLSRTTTTIDPGVRLNLGHTYFQLHQYHKAKPQYQTLLQSEQPDLRAVAATQLGIIACIERDTAQALVLFRRALLENTENEPARYNFELVKNQYSGKPSSARPLTARRPALTRQPIGQQVERSERRDDLLKRFQRLNLTEEQALQLLDAMRNDDLPYALSSSARRLGANPESGNIRW